MNGGVLAARIPKVERGQHWAVSDKACVRHVRGPDDRSALKTRSAFGEYSDRKSLVAAVGFRKPSFRMNHRVERQPAIPGEIEVASLVLFADLRSRRRDVGSDEDWIGALVFSCEFGETQASLSCDPPLAARFHLANQPPV